MLELDYVGTGHLDLKLQATEDYLLVVSKKHRAEIRHYTEKSDINTWNF